MICVCGVIVVMIDNEMTKIRYFADTYFPFLPKSVSMQKWEGIAIFFGSPFSLCHSAFFVVVAAYITFQKDSHVIPSEGEEYLSCSL